MNFAVVFECDSIKGSEGSRCLTARLFSGHLSAATRMAHRVHTTFLVEGVVDSEFILNPEVFHPCFISSSFLCNSRRALRIKEATWLKFWPGAEQWHDKSIVEHGNTICSARIDILL
jgi:hypothetical protein